MSISSAEFDLAFGLASFPTSRAKALLTFREVPGNPNGILTPGHLGEVVFDTTNGAFYKAVDIAAKRFAQIGGAPSGYSASTINGEAVTYLGAPVYDNGVNVITLGA